MAKEKKSKSADAKASSKSSSKAAAPETAVDAVPPRLREKYRSEIVPLLVKRFGYQNVNRAPRLEKISVNMGVGAAAADGKLIEVAARELGQLAGQRPAIAKSRKAISNFKLRENLPIGCHVTLRGSRMYEFLDRLINLAIPRVRDFRGLPDRSFDGRGNYTMGIKEQIIFPEIDVDKVTRVNGMDVTIVTTASTDEEAYELLKAFGFPFRKREADAEKGSA
jgi:large subunit ribosomal protein L5